MCDDRKGVEEEIPARLSILNQLEGGWLMSIDVSVPEYTLKFLYFAKQSTHISLTINKLVKEFHEYQTRIFDSLLALNKFFVCVLPLVAYIELNIHFGWFL